MTMSLILEYFDRPKGGLPCDYSLSWSILIGQKEDCSMTTSLSWSIKSLVRPKKSLRLKSPRCIVECKVWSHSAPGVVNCPPAMDGDSPQLPVHGAAARAAGQASARLGARTP